MTKNKLALKTCFRKRVRMECWTDSYWRYTLFLPKTTTTHAQRHTDTQTLTQRGMSSAHMLSLPHIHTHIFMTTNWISSVWRQGLLLWRQQVFSRGDGHRKEGGILSTHSFPFCCPSCCQTKEMDGKKRGGDGDRKQEPLQWQVLCRQSDRSFLSFIRPLPLSLSLPHTPSSPLISFSSFHIPSLHFLLSSLPLITAPSAPSPLLLISSLKSG